MFPHHHNHQNSNNLYNNSTNSTAHLNPNLTNHAHHHNSSHHNSVVGRKQKMMSSSSKHHQQQQNTLQQQVKNSNGRRFDLMILTPKSDSWPEPDWSWFLYLTWIIHYNWSSLVCTRHHHFHPNNLHEEFSHLHKSCLLFSLAKFLWEKWV